MKIAEFAKSTLVHRCDGRTDRQTDILYYNCPDFNHRTVVQSSKMALTQNEMHKRNQQFRRAMRLKQESKWCTLRRSSQGVLYCQNITWFHGTRAKVMLFTATTELLRPSGKSAQATGCCGRCLHPTAMYRIAYGSYLIYVLQKRDFQYSDCRRTQNNRPFFEVRHKTRKVPI